MTCLSKQNQKNEKNSKYYNWFISPFILFVSFFTCDIVVSGKVLLSNSHSVHSVWVPLTLTIHWSFDSVLAGLVQLYCWPSGAANTIASWCHATGNFIKEIARQTRICHLPRAPIASCTASTSSPWSPDSGSFSFVTFLPFTSAETIEKWDILNGHKELLFFFLIFGYEHFGSFLYKNWRNYFCKLT